MKRTSSVVVAFVLLGAVGFALAGCSGSKRSAVTTTSTEGVTEAPSVRIVRFRGPNFVRCRGGETHMLSFRYAMKNAQTIDPRVDARPVAAHAIYDLRRGTIRFPYVCPGPHSFKITATGKNNGFASAGVTFDKSNRGDSATYGVAVESSG
jgi:hypothetical protein